MKLFKKRQGGIWGVSDHRSTFRGLLIICLVIAALSVGISTLFYQAYKRSLMDEVIASGTQTLDKTDMLISEVIEQIESIAYQQSLATARLINASREDIAYDYYRLQQLTDNLINMCNSHSYIHSAYIYFNQGSVIITSFMGVTSFRLFYDTAWIDEYRGHAGETRWINGRLPYDPQYDNIQEFLDKYHGDNSEVLTLLVPLSGSLRNRGGVIVINVYEKEIAKLIGDFPDATEMLMADSGGRIIVSAESGDLYTELPAAIFSVVREAEATDGSLKYRDAGGEDYICVFAHSRFNGNYIIETFPLSQTLKPVTGVLMKTIAYALLFFVICLAFALLLVFFSYQPVRQLYKELGKLAPDAEGKLGGVQNSISRLVSDHKALTRLWNNNRMLIKHRTLSLLLQGKVNAFDSDPKRLEFLEIHFPSEYFACCVLHLDMPPRPTIILDEQYEAIKMQLFTMVQQCLAPPIGGYTVDLDALNIALLVNVPDNAPGTLLNLCQQIQQVAAASGIIPYTLSIGIGNYVAKLDGITLSYQQACSAMRYAAGNCPGDVISFSSISVTRTHLEWGGSPEEDELLDAVSIGDKSTAALSLNSWFEKLRCSDFPVDACGKIVANHIGRVISLLPEIGITAAFSAQEVNNRIMSLSQMEEIEAFAARFIGDICSQIQVRREHKNAEMMEKIMAYLRQNYAQDVSLSQVAEGVYMSVPYLCKIFKEYTHKTFNDYLTSLRVEASLPLLESSSKKVKDIAVKVGYSNTQSYIRAFKRHKKMTPSEFRETFISKKLQPPLP